VHFKEIVDTGEHSYDEVEGSGLVVSRTAHRNNSSHYFVDGKKSSYGEVTALLKAKGVDLATGRFLILQGEVEQIALMKPKAATQHETGLLEYLEDVIGTDRYVEAIEAGAKELDTLNDARSSALARSRAAARERDGAAGAADEARAHLAKEREAASLRRCLAELDSSKASAVAEEARSSIQGLVEVEAAAKKASKEAAEALAEARHKADGRSAEHARVSATLDAARAAFADCERRDCSLREDLKHLRAAEKTAEEAAVAAEAAKAKAENEALEADAEAPLAASEAEQASQELERERLAAEKLRASSAVEAEGRAKKLAEARDAAMPWESRLAQAKAASSVAAAALESLRESRDEAARRATEARQAVTDAERALREAEAAAAASAGGVEAAVEGARVARERAAAADAAVAESTSNLRSARALLASKRDAAHAARSAGAAAAALRDARSRGVIPGFRGRLGDLGVIDARFDVAVSAACPALDNFVVDDTAAAQACVSLLRKGNYGVATFLILEKQHHLARFVDERPRPQAPEDVPRLFDLITPSSADLAPAFYYATRDTVVASDLDQAARISFDRNVDPRWRRAVTLSGELVNESGTMTGGGAKPRGGRMKLMTSSGGKGEDAAVAAAAAAAAAATSTVTAQDLAEAEAAVAAAEAALSKAKRDASSALEAISAADAAVEEARQAGPRAQLERSAAAERAADAKAALAALVESSSSSSTSSLEAAIAEAEEAAAEAARAVAEVTRGSFAARAAVAAAEDALGSVGGSALAAKLAACKRLEEAVAAAGARGARALAKAAAARRSATKAEEEFARANSEKTTASSSLAETETRARALEEEALEIMRSAQEAAAALEVASADSRATRELASAAQADADASRLSEVEASEGLRAAREGAKAALERARRAGEAAEEARAALAAADVAVEEAKVHDEEEEEEGESSGDDDDEIDAAAVEEEEEAELSDDDEEEDRERSASLDDDDTAPLRRQAPSSRRRSPGKKEKKTSKNRKQKPAAPLPSPLSAEELAALDAPALASQLQRLQQQLDATVPDLAALAAHSRASKDASRKARELEKVTEKRNDARSRHDALRKKRLDEFMSGFAAISSRLKEMYRLITLGGDAELELVDSLDPFAEGVVFSVRPPKKAWKNISNLSGGEKTLSSLALVFALHHFKPTPLYVMDEIDAALDFRNVSIVAHYIKERVTKGAQFVIISLRNDMFELADRLVGIYKTHDATKCVAVDPRDYACAGAPLPLTASSGGNAAIAVAAPNAAAAANANAVQPRAAVV
jgi:structural maintenance of chromosome 4